MMKKMNNKIISIIFLVTLFLSNFFVINTVLAEVETYNFITKWGTQGSNEGQFNYPSDITVDNNGYVYVLDAKNNRIQKFSNNGTFILQWGSVGSENGQFNYTADTKWGLQVVEAGITVDKVGNIYVADPYNHRTQKFSNNGVFLTKFDPYGSDIAVDKEGNLYVSNYNNTRIQKFNNEGIWQASWNDSYKPLTHDFVSIDVDNAGYIYTLEINGPSGGTGIIQRFDSNGILQNSWSVSSMEYPVQSPRGLTVDNEGFIYIVAVGVGMQYRMLNFSYSDPFLVTGINKYTNSGKIVTRWGNPGTYESYNASSDGEFSYPEGVAVDSLGNVFVADTGNNRVQKFAKIPTVSEFSSTLIFPLFITLTLLTSIIYFKKHKQLCNQKLTKC